MQQKIYAIIKTTKATFCNILLNIAWYFFCLLSYCRTVPNIHSTINAHKNNDSKEIMIADRANLASYTPSIYHHLL